VRKQSWDLAFKDAEHSDFVAGQWWLRAFLEGKNAKGDTIKEAHYFLCDEPVFDQLGFVETIAAIRSKRYTWPSTEILIEDKANGPAVDSALRHEIPNIRMIEPLGSKISRVHACAPVVADGKVHLLRGPSTDRMIKVLTQFPRVRRDDEVDAFSQAILEMKKAASFEEAMRVVRGEA
jgi:predicted phage terminase large subunit-like protein